MIAKRWDWPAHPALWYETDIYLLVVFFKCSGQTTTRPSTRNVNKYIEVLFEIRLRHDRDPASEAYQDFVAWVDENSVLGARGAAAEINYAFLPVTRLQSYSTLTVASYLSC
jgi:hypothetical protein